MDPAREENVAPLRPAPGQPVPARHGQGAAFRRARARHDRLPRRGEHRGENLVRQAARGDRNGAGGDQHAPGRRAVRLCQGFDHVEVRQRIHLSSTERAGQQETIEPGIGHGLHERLGQRALALHLVRGGPQPGRQRLHRGEHIVTRIARAGPSWPARRRKRHGLTDGFRPRRDRASGGRPARSWRGVTGCAG